MMTIPPIPYPHLHNRPVKSSQVTKPKVTAAVIKRAGQSVFLSIQAMISGTSKVVNALVSSLQNVLKGKFMLALGDVVKGIAQSMIVALAIPILFVGLFLQFLVLVVNELT